MPRARPNFGIGCVPPLWRARARPPPSAAAACVFISFLLCFSLFQLLSSVEGVEEAVVVQDSRSERGGAGAAPPLPPYPNIGELNLDGKTLS